MKGKPGKGKFQTKINSLKSALSRARDTNVTESSMAEVNVVDLLPPHPPVKFNTVSFGNDEVHEINMVSSGSISEALAACTTKPIDILSADKLYQAALDSACNRSCAGNQWVQTMLEALQFAPTEIQQLVN